MYLDLHPIIIFVFILQVLIPTQIQTNDESAETELKTGIVMYLNSGYIFMHSYTFKKETQNNYPSFLIISTKLCELINTENVVPTIEKCLANFINSYININQIVGDKIIFYLFQSNNIPSISLEDKWLDKLMINGGFFIFTGYKLKYLFQETLVLSNQMESLLYCLTASYNSSEQKLKNEIFLHINSDRFILGRIKKPELSQGKNSFLFSYDENYYGIYHQNYICYGVYYLEIYTLAKLILINKKKKDTVIFDPCRVHFNRPFTLQFQLNEKCSRGLQHIFLNSENSKIHSKFDLLECSKLIYETMTDLDICLSIKHCFDDTEQELFKNLLYAESERENGDHQTLTLIHEFGSLLGDQTHTMETLVKMVKEMCVSKIMKIDESPLNYICLYLSYIHAILVNFGSSSNMILKFIPSEKNIAIGYGLLDYRLNAVMLRKIETDNFVYLMPNEVQIKDSEFNQLMKNPSLNLMPYPNLHNSIYLETFSSINLSIPTITAESTPTTSSKLGIFISVILSRTTSVDDSQIYLKVESIKEGDVDGVDDSSSKHHPKNLLYWSFGLCMGLLFTLVTISIILKHKKRGFPNNNNNNTIKCIKEL